MADGKVCSMLSSQATASASSITSIASGKSTGGGVTPGQMIKDAEFFSSLEGLSTEGKDWCSTYSLKSLKLTLEAILDYARIERVNVLVEFPFFHYLKALNKIDELPQSPSKPHAQMNQTKLSQKRKELKLLVRFYENRIYWLCHGSRKYFGLIRGSRIAMIVETSDQLFSLGSGLVAREYSLALNKLVEDQFEKKDLVYCIWYGSSPTMTNPQGFPFTKFTQHCVCHVKEWVSNLQRGGTNNIYSALQLALTIKNLDTIVVVMTTDPDQPLDIIQHYMVDKLTGEKRPKLHLVAFRGSSNVQTSFRDLARETHGHYHGYSPDYPHNDQLPNLRSNARQRAEGKSSGEGSGHEQAVENAIGEMVEDSDVDSVKGEISKARKILIDIESLKSGLLDYTLLEQLRELSVSINWEEDDDFPRQATPTASLCIACSADDWTRQFGVNSKGLNLYKFLAPDAYPQLQDHVSTTNSTVVSHVYNVMPLLPWDDGSLKYIHVDVHRLERYISSLDTFIVDCMLDRLGWMLSGSRVPFGILMERRVLVLLDCSCSVMGELLALQQHLRMLLREQLAHVQDFNLVSYGKTCRLWTSDFAEPHRQSLLQAWEWVLGMSPAGSGDLLTALKVVFESGQVLDNYIEEECEEGTIGIYLVASSLPDQTTDVLCSYLEQVLSGLDVRVHVVFYDMEPLAGPPAFQLDEAGGRCGLEGQVEECLRALAKVGRGTFHHFKVSGSCEGEELSRMVGVVDNALGYANTARKLLQDYKEFCKRNVPPLDVSTADDSVRHCSPLPPYPRQTTASLARMNLCLSHKMEMERKRAQSQRLILKARKKLYCVKDQFFYTGRGLNKVNAAEVVRQSSSKKKAGPLIPDREEHITSEKWVSLYGLDALHLTFDSLIRNGGGGFGSHPAFKHFNSQGKLVDLQVNAQGLKEFRHKTRAVLARYCSRLQWLAQDYRRYLGVVTEREVIVLVDVSSSMLSHLPEVKEALSLLLKNMPVKMKRFNLVAYSNAVDKWRSSLQPWVRGSGRESDTENPLDSALQWTSQLQGGGNSYLLQALKVCLESGAQGIYLVTDGSTDHTHDFLLQQISWLKSNYKTEWRINTLAWYCSNRGASFLKELAHRTGGRYHPYPDWSEADDYRILHKEIIRTEKELAKVNDFI